MRLVLKVILLWLALSIPVSLLVALVIKGGKEQPVRREHPDPPVRLVPREQRANRDPLAYPGYQGPRVIPDRQVR